MCLSIKAGWSLDAEYRQRSETLELKNMLGHGPQYTIYVLRPDPSTLVGRGPSTVLLGRYWCPCRHCGVMTLGKLLGNPCGVFTGEKTSSVCNTKC